MAFYPPSRSDSGYRGKTFHVFVLGHTPASTPYVVEDKSFKKAAKRAVKDHVAPGTEFRGYVLVQSMTQNGHPQEALYEAQRYNKTINFQIHGNRANQKLMGWRIVRAGNPEAVLSSFDAASIPKTYLLANAASSSSSSSHAEEGEDAAESDEEFTY